MMPVSSVDSPLSGASQPLAAAWADALAVLRGAVDDAAWRRTAQALDRARARLPLLDRLAAASEDLRPLVLATIAGLTAMTRRLMADGDSRELLAWLAAQEGQLAARLAGWRVPNGSTPA
jgi:hypothetical protein